MDWQASLEGVQCDPMSYKITTSDGILQVKITCRTGSSCPSLERTISTLEMLLCPSRRYATAYFHAEGAGLLAVRMLVDVILGSVQLPRERAAYDKSYAADVEDDRGESHA